MSDTYQVHWGEPKIIVASPDEPKRLIASPRGLIQLAGESDPSTFTSTVVEMTATVSAPRPEEISLLVVPTSEEGAQST